MFQPLETTTPSLTTRREQPVRICVTPVKNEAWILDRFIQCNSTWADYIILADQGSTDDTRKIAARYNNVILVENPDPTYSEESRQKLLLKHAREIPGPRFILALDADEILSANWMDSPEWESVLQAPPGTIIRMQWVNIWPDFRHGWIHPKRIPFGFIDDGSPHTGSPIHSPRVPLPPEAPSLSLNDIKVLHLQYTNWERMKSKQRWYQCWERIHYPQKRPITLYRQYHEMDAAILKHRTPLQPEWLQGYLAQGIDMTSVQEAPYYHWDVEILQWLARYGADYFRKVDIWDVDWHALAHLLHMDIPAERLRDPRTMFEKMVFLWLKQTQPDASLISVRLKQQLLALFGW